MNTEPVDPQAMLRLRALSQLDHAGVARLCELTEAQVQELEAAAHGQFATPALKVQAALKVAATLGGVNAEGEPRVHVLRAQAASVNAHVPRPSTLSKSTPERRNKFPDSPEFLKLLLVFVVLVFLLVAVAMPLLYALPSPPPKLS